MLWGEQNRGLIRLLEENHVCFCWGTGLPGTVTPTLLWKSAPQRGLAHTLWDKRVVTGGQSLNENTITDTEPVNIPDSRGLNEERDTMFEQIHWSATKWRPLSLRWDVFQTQLLFQRSCVYTAAESGRILLSSFSELHISRRWPCCTVYNTSVSRTTCPRTF